MNLEIRKYPPERDYEILSEIIKAEGEEWAPYLDQKYRTALRNSITYVATLEDSICGYARSMEDHGYYIWILDLLVAKKFRGNAIGRKLMETLVNEYPDYEVYVMSDVDDYYQKLGYKNEGTIFCVKK